MAVSPPNGADAHQELRDSQAGDFRVVLARLKNAHTVAAPAIKNAMLEIQNDVSAPVFRISSA